MSRQRLGKTLESHGAQWSADEPCITLPVSAYSRLRSLASAGAHLNEARVASIGSGRLALLEDGRIFATSVVLGLGLAWLA